MKSFYDFQNKSQRLYEGILSSNGVGIKKSLLDTINYDDQNILDIDIQDGKIVGYVPNWGDKKMCQNSLRETLHFEGKKINYKIIQMVIDYNKDGGFWDTAKVKVDDKTDMTELLNASGVNHIKVEYRVEGQMPDSVVKKWLGMKPKNKNIEFSIRKATIDNLDLSECKTTQLTFHDSSVNQLTILDSFKNMEDVDSNFYDLKINTLTIKKSSGKCKLSNIFQGWNTTIEHLVVEDGIKCDASGKNITFPNIDDLAPQKKFIKVGASQLRKSSKNPALWSDERDNGKTLNDMTGRPVKVGDLIIFAGGTANGFSRTDMRAMIEPVVSVGTARFVTKNHGSLKPECVMKIEREDLKKYDINGVYKNLY